MYLRESIWKSPFIEVASTKLETYCVIRGLDRNYYRIAVTLSFLWEEFISPMTMRGQGLSHRAIHRTGAEVIL